MEANYVIEITTFKFNSDVEPGFFWAEDAKVEALYTSKQPGFMSRESAYNEEEKEVIVVVRWKTQQDADASMEKFMNDETVATYATLIDANTMKMNRYEVQ